MIATPDADPNLGRVLGGNYRIDAPLGHGGMGVVYRGVQLSVNRAVAIKLILPATSHEPELVARFRREAEATAQLTHVNNVRLFDFGVTEAQELYMVMELLQGTNLADRLDGEGRMPPAEALHVACQILRGLSEAHSLGIVHRDLKPSNVFLARVHGNESVAKILDFGMARIAQAADDTKLTRTGSVLGTPAYMSPEQARGLQADRRSDLYSVGVMLFEMLTGRLPFESQNIAGFLLAHVMSPPPRLSEVEAYGLDVDALQRLLDQLLAKEPEQRPASVGAVLESIQELTRSLERASEQFDAARAEVQELADQLRALIRQEDGFEEASVSSTHATLPLPATGELSELEWHLSIDGETWGPFETSALLQRLDECGWQAYVWRDGFGDWTHAPDVSELMLARPEPWSPSRVDS